jgi:hypothetical protein
VITIDDYKTYEQAKENITDNGLVISETYPSHEGVPNTASYTIEGTNHYECESNTVTVTPPPVGPVKIVKSLETFVVDEAPTFTFNVEVWYNPDDHADWEHGEKVYANVHQIAFTYQEFQSGVTSKSVTINKLPVGSHVIVEEIYEGARYTAVGDVTGSTTVEWSAAEIASGADTPTVTFTNTGNNNTGGHGLLNEFVYDDKSWQHQAKEDGSDKEVIPDAK